MTTWRESFEQAFHETGDVLDKLVFAPALDEIPLDDETDDEYIPFTAWSDNYVYFPAGYDSSMWVDFVPRNPNGRATEYIGGGC
jgi:hypothetical protein